MPLDLKERFLARGYEFNFFQAVHLLERLLEGSRVGTGDELTEEPIRFETLNSIAFPPSDVAFIAPARSWSTQLDEANKVYAAPVPVHELEGNFHDILNSHPGALRVVVTFMGLYGVSSPLPSYFVDPLTLQKQAYFELKKFIDIFGHRVYSLFYRSWKKYRHHTQFRPEGRDGYSRCLLSLVGQQIQSSRNRREVRQGDVRLIPYGRFLGHRVRSARSLQQLLCAYFGFPRVRVRPFLGDWVRIPVLTRLGEERVQLGISTLLGDRMMDFSSQFLIEIGPVDSSTYEKFLPRGRSAAAFEAAFQTEGGSQETEGDEDALSRSGTFVLGFGARDDAAPHGERSMVRKVKQVVDLFLRDPLDYRIRVILDVKDGQGPAIGFGGARLGAASWLGDRPREPIAVVY